MEDENPTITSLAKMLAEVYEQLLASQKREADLIALVQSLVPDAPADKPAPKRGRPRKTQPDA